MSVVLDLCRKNNIDGYPQMNLYKDGKYLETFNQARGLDILTNYIAVHAEPHNSPAPEPPSKGAAPPATAEKDELAEQIVSHEDYNPTGTVLSLDEKNFRETVDKGHVFVKFFAPWYVSLPSSLLFRVDLRLGG